MAGKKSANTIANTTAEAVRSVAVNSTLPTERRKHPIHTTETLATRAQCRLHRAQYRLSLQLPSAVPVPFPPFPTPEFALLPLSVPVPPSSSPLADLQGSYHASWHSNRLRLICGGGNGGDDGRVAASSQWSSPFVDTLGSWKTTGHL